MIPMLVRIICPYCYGSPADAYCWCDGCTVVEVSGEDLQTLARSFGTITYFIDDKVYYMNANANAVIQTLSDDQLRGCDFLALIDHSGSMAEASIRRAGISRFEELAEDATAIARDAQKFDDDGLTVVAFSSAVRVFDGVTADKVKQVFQEVGPRGSTNLTEALQAAIAKVENSSKNGVIFVFTDGVPDDEKSVFQLIDKAGERIGRPRIGITFIQVGEDPKATAFLDKLNSQLSVDIVAVAHAKDAEGLTLGQLAWMAQNS